MLVSARRFQDLGVLPPGFRSKPLHNRYNCGVIGRFGPGVSQREALAELNVIQSSIAKQVEEGVQLQAVPRPMHETMVGDVRTGLYLALAAVGFSRLLESMLLEAAPLDTATFLATPALLVAAALAACLTPAFRASLIPPMTVLRYE